MKTLNSKIETITPAIAREYLKANAANRPIRSKHVQKLRDEMTAGRWLITHQGIAFDENGKLLDGQHRLFAIAMGTVNVQMMVTRGIDSKSADSDLYVMDVIDCGSKRTTADQLHLMHGQRNATLAVATAGMIAMACTGGPGRIIGVSVGQAVPILEIYGEAFSSLFEFCGKSKIGRNSAIMAALCLGYHIDKDMALEFMLGISSGENIKSGDPIYALREKLIARSGKHGGNCERYALMQTAANCFYHAIRAEPVHQAKPSTQGMDFLLGKQAQKAERVRESMGKATAKAAKKPASK